ncbi:MAG: cytochrome c [Burkholderiales bacterium]
MDDFARTCRGACLGLLLGFAPFATASPGIGECPQPRFTGKAPDEYYNRPNPLTATPENLASGEEAYRGEPRRISCATCHGLEGDGKGPLASQFEPPPRNFACAQTIKGVPDGQLFWIIRFGSPETSMPPHRKLSDERIWQLVLHLRHLAR